MNEFRHHASEEETSIRDPRVVPEPIDEGKEVVGSDYHPIGMVSEVQENTLYVAPNTALPDRLRRKLNWDTHREIDHPLSTQFIREITDEIVLTVKWKQEQQSAFDGY